MSTLISNKFLDRLRKHLDSGVPLKDMAFTDEQKRRVEVCLDAYKRFETDPYMKLRDYLRNRWKRTYSEIANDLKVIEYIASLYVKGQRNISLMKVRHSANLMMANGASTGNMKAVNDGAKLLVAVDELDKPETAKTGEQLIDMPLVITADVSRKIPGKTTHSEEELDRIRRKWGVKKDRWQDLLEAEEQEYVPEPADEEDSELGFMAMEEEEG